MGRFNDSVGQCEADCNSFQHAGIQHESFSGVVFVHQCVFLGCFAPMYTSSFAGKEEEAECDTHLHDAYRSSLGAVAWVVLTRAELAVYVQALQRRAHAPRIKDCKRLSIVIRHMKRHKRGLKSVTLKHPLKLVAFTDVPCKAQPGEPTGLALRGLAATFREDGGGGAKPHGDNGEVDFVDFIARRQRRIVRSTFSAEFNGFVNSVEQMLPLQCTWHHVYSGTAQRPERIADLFEGGLLYPPLDQCVDARAVYDAISATDACEFAGSSLKVHLISVGDRMPHGLIRNLFRVDARDMPADGPTKGGIGRLLLHNVSNGCKHKVSHDVLVRQKGLVGSATIGPPSKVE